MKKSLNTFIFNQQNAKKLQLIAKSKIYFAILENTIYSQKSFKCIMMLHQAGLKNPKSPVFFLGRYRKSDPLSPTIRCLYNVDSLKSSRRSISSYKLIVQGENAVVHESAVKLA